MVHRSGARASNFTESDYKLLNESGSINEIVNNEEIFKERASNAMMRINDINTKKDDSKSGILLKEQYDD